jgi:hypothetical protein
VVFGGFLQNKKSVEPDVNFPGFFIALKWDAPIFFFWMILLMEREFVSFRLCSGSGN